MADSKISELTAITGANTADDDLLVIVDTSASQTKKITLGELENALAERDFSFGDNDKLTFGASSDLQIYSDGTNAVIKEDTGGSLYIGGADIHLMNPAFTEYYISAVENGAVTLRYDNLPKLATTSTGISVTGNATFADNGKAIFGAGSDLQIYHTGAHSYVDDTGTGNLYLNSNGAGTIITGAAETQAQFFTNGAVNLFYDNSKKLATTSTGIDVTGRIEGDTLNIGDQAATHLIQAYDNSGSTPISFGLGEQVNTARAMRIEKVDEADADPYATNFYFADHPTSSTGSLNFFASQAKNKTLRISSNGDISFYEDTGTTAKFFWDASAERLGLGTTTPSSKVHLVESDPKVELTRTSDFYYGRLSADGFSAFTNANGNAPVIFRTATNERMRIDSSGNVGIGTSSPSALGHINSTSVGTQDVLILSQLGNTGARDEVGLRFKFNSGGVDGATIRAVKTTAGGSDLTISTGGASNAAAAERMRITSSGSVGIGTSSPNSLLHISSAGSTVLNVEATGANDSRVRITAGNSNISYVEFADPDDVDTGEIRYEHATNNMQFRVSGNSEAMRIDSSGNLLIGTTSPTSAGEEGIALSAGSYGGYIAARRASGNPLTLDRRTNDGDIAIFQKDGATVGSIGAFNGDLSVGTGDTALRFHDGGNRIEPFNVSTNANTDGAVDLGVTGARFKDLYLSGGVYLGGTGAANKLDDYEEGTWTPVTNSGSWTVNSAKYTKVGHMVTCTFDVTATSTISANDLTGLPFTPNTNSAGVVGYQNSQSGEVFSILVQSSSIWNFRVGSTQYGLANGSLVRGMFTYTTNS